MNINNVSSSMNLYSMSSFWNVTNNGSSNGNVPLVGSIDSYVQDSYSKMKLSGTSQDQELQNIFNTVQPSINVSNNVSPTAPNAFSTFQNSINSSLISSLNSNSPIGGDILSLYTSLENGTYKPTQSSIMASNPYSLYSNINSLQGVVQQTGNFLNATS